MKKVRDYLRKFNKIAPHIVTLLVMLDIITGLSVKSLLFFTVYMVYVFYTLFDEFVNHHRLRSSMQYRDFLDNRGLTEAKENAE